MAKPILTVFVGGVADGREIPVIGQTMRGKARPAQTVPITDAAGNYTRHVQLEDSYTLTNVNGRHVYMEDTLRKEDLPEIIERYPIPKQ